jgi:hypothetical protein
VAGPQEKVVIGSGDIDPSLLEDSPSLGVAAGSGPALANSCGRTLRADGERCWTTSTAAGRSAGKDAHRRRSASTPPAEEPMTMMSLVCMRDSFVAKRGNKQKVRPSAFMRPFRRHRI